MERTPIYTASPWKESYSEIIDVRSPAEYAEDHLPNAINLPVLNNEERAKVGTIYKQISPFEARKIGSSLVAKNISSHLNTHFASKEKDYSPLVYCWRGGQRSNSLAHILTQVGWRVTVLEGGYKTYRTYVREELKRLTPQLSYKILCGLTGSGKTYLLQQLSQQGGQVLDLEGLANHRGSLLGQVWENQLQLQPSQKRFESLLLQKLKEFDCHKPVWVESESNTIGEIHVPSQLWKEMKRSPCIEIQLPLEERVKWLLQEYSHLTKNLNLLKYKLQWLTSRHGKKKIEEWYSLIDSSQLDSFVKDILINHYDPAYQRSVQHSFSNQLEKSLQLPNLSNNSIANAINELLKLKT
ncbi:MAG: tRNA 2-selenouridine(34) synthase MnmH [Chroococcales cyanobacterium]